MDLNQFREAAHSSVDEIVRYYDTIEERRVVSNVEPGYLRKLLPETAPADGEAWADIQKDIEAKILPGITHWNSPNFMAWFPSSSSFPGMLGEMYSAAFTGAAFNWICSPAVTELETIVLDWLAKALGLPECYLSTGSTAGGGVIHSTASECITTLMVAARDKYLRETLPNLTGEDLEDAWALKRSKLVALGSSFTHTSTKKAAQIAGVRFRTIPVKAEDGYIITGAALKSTIEELRAKGLEPFWLTGTLGTTDTCSVDDLAGIASTLAAVAPPGPGEVWVHVDAAYAGVAMVCPEHQVYADALAQFHSFNTNLHKWLLTNFDCSTVFVRRRSHLIDALSVNQSVYHNQYTNAGLVTDYRDWQIPLGRRFRSLKIWFVMRTFGISGLQAHVRNGIRLGELFASLVAGRADLFEIVTGPSFALTVFKLRAGAAATLGEQNALTKRVCEAVNAEGNIFVTSTTLGDVYAIRVCPSTPYVEDRHVRRAFDIFVEATEKALA